MKLTQKATCSIVLLVIGLGGMSAAMLRGLWGLQRDVHATFDEYRESRLIRHAEVSIASAEALLMSKSPDYEGAMVRLKDAARQLDAFLAFQNQAPHRHLRPTHEELEARRALSTVQSVLDLIAHLGEARQPRTSTSQAAGVVAMLDDVLQNLDHLSRVFDTAVGNSREAANVKLRSTIALVASLCLAIIMISLLTSMWQYRSVMRPLRRLREGVRRMSSGRFSERIAVTRNGEFAELTEEFNRMALELDDLYRSLESKVAEKSKELVRSERLASVGFLAAGMAHEINNPLNIISGYAEKSLKRLGSNLSNANAEDTRQALQIIRDESFRCKVIIEKLLALSRSGKQSYTRVSLAHIAEEVTSMVSCLKLYQTRRVSLRVDDSDELPVLGNESELKQVLLNLTVNALEAIESGAGEVRIECGRRDTWAELLVTDNGRGMSAQTLEHVFEPFFTDRRNGGERGLGLGLSITHAIVEAHRGHILAHSDGPGRGSRFIVQLPIVEGNQGS